MSNGGNILISLTPRHAESVFSGFKTVELRRKTMRINSGTKAWVYVKLPVGAIIGNVEIKAVHALSPTMLWRRFGSVSGLSESEFFNYFEGVEIGTALELGELNQFENMLPLHALRLITGKFQPPQFFTYLSDHDPILRAAIAKLQE
jgi:predicted transcriptional regulator